MKFTSTEKTTFKQLQKTIKHLLDKYLTSEQEKDVSVTGIINWLSYKGRGNGGESPFDDDGMIERKEHFEAYKAAKDKIKENLKAAGLAHEAVLNSAANDLIAQVEMAANFRRTKVAHHFAKSRYNLVDYIGKGAENGSVLEAYTTEFLDNGLKFIKRGHGDSNSSS